MEILGIRIARAAGTRTGRRGVLLRAVTVPTQRGQIQYESTRTQSVHFVESLDITL